MKGKKEECQSSKLGIKKWIHLHSQSSQKSLPAKILALKRRMLTNPHISVIARSGVSFRNVVIDSEPWRRPMVFRRLGHVIDMEI